MGSIDGAETAMNVTDSHNNTFFQKV